MSDYTTKFIRNTTDGKILAEVLRRGKDDLVSWYAAYNPNCPPEALAEVVRRGKDNLVSLYAAKNPIYEKYLEKIKEEEEKLKLQKELQEERFNTNIRSSVNNLFYGIMIDE